MPRTVVYQALADFRCTCTTVRPTKLVFLHFIDQCTSGYIQRLCSSSLIPVQRFQPALNVSRFELGDGILQTPLKQIHGTGNDTICRHIRLYDLLRQMFG